MSKKGKVDLVEKFVEIYNGNLEEGSSKLTKKEARKLVQVYQETVEELVSEVGDVLDLQSFLRIEKYMAPARNGVNPSTGEPMKIESQPRLKAKAKF